jgi:ABC-type glycerol-3-phosphate transport system substrate-binding protein
MQFGMKGNVGLMYWWTPYFYLVTKAGYMVKEDSVLGIDGKPNYDKYRCALLPRNPAKTQVISVGGWSFGIPTYSANKEEAWEFIKWVTSAKTQKKWDSVLSQAHTSLQTFQENLSMKIANFKKSIPGFHYS